MTADEIALLAARVTALALRHSIPERRVLESSEVLLLPEMILVSNADLIEMLTKAPKPLLCLGVRLMGTLAVARWASVGEQAQAHDTIARSEIEWMEQDIGTGSDVRIVVQGFDEQFSISSVVIRQWYADYQLPCVDRSLEPVSGASKSEGVTVILRFSPSSGGRPKRLFT